MYLLRTSETQSNASILDTSQLEWISYSMFTITDVLHAVITIIRIYYYIPLKELLFMC
jgi:hypothetical protein